MRTTLGMQPGGGGGRLKSHKHQHFVPKSYLRAWCDPGTPVGHEPYVWVFAKDGSAPRRKAPSKLFRETDLYTIVDPDGGRNLVLEKGLSQLEKEFARMRDGSPNAPYELDRRDRTLVTAFVAAMYLRTPTMRDHWAGQLQGLVDKADDMAEWAKTASPEQLRAMSSMPSSDGQRISLEEMRAAARNPLQTVLLPQLRTLTSELLRMDAAVLTVTGDSRFITSDFPCVWFDPEAYKRPPFYRSPALIYPSIEIMLPISPVQMLMLQRRGLTGTAEVPDELVDDLNRRTRFHCDKSFITHQNYTNPVWFDPGTVPDDAYRPPESADGLIDA